jgi:hypothetical protein
MEPLRTFRCQASALEFHCPLCRLISIVMISIVGTSSIVVGYHAVVPKDIVLVISFLDLQ